MHISHGWNLIMWCRIRDEGLDNVVYEQILCQKTFGQALNYVLCGTPPSGLPLSAPQRGVKPGADTTCNLFPLSLPSPTSEGGSKPLVQPGKNRALNSPGSTCCGVKRESYALNAPP